MTFAPHIKPVWAKSQMFGTKHITAWGNVRGDLSIPLTKATAMASISKNLLVYTIKWEPLIRSLQNVVTLWPYSWLLAFRVLLETLILAKKSDVFFQGRTLFWPYLQTGCFNWCETKKKSIGWILDMICKLDLWPITHDLDLGCFKIFRNGCISGIVSLIDVKWKGSELIG